MSTIQKVYEAIQPLMQASRGDDAIRALRNILSSFPDFAQAHHDLACLLYQASQKQEALRHYEAAAAAAPGHPDFQKMLGDFYYVESARIEDALGQYRKVLQLRPGDVQTRMTVGNILVSLQRFGQADEQYRKVLEIDPQHIEAAEMHRRLGECQRGGTSGTTSAESMYAEAKRSAESGDVKGAVQQLERIVNLHPHFALAHNDLAVLSYQMGNKERALNHYAEASRLQPDNSTFRKNLADFYWVEQGRTEEALKIYVRILEESPRDIEALNAVARVCEAMGQRKDARVFYERILEIEPWNADANAAVNRLEAPRVDPAEAADSPQGGYEEAARLVAAGDTAAARERLHALVAAHPGHALAQNDLGVLSYQAGDRQEALERYETAARLEPSNMTFQKNLADCYWVGFGRYEDALKIYVDVLSAYPEDIETLHATGRLCLALGRPEDARVFFERVLEIEPWNAEAGQELDRLAAAANAA